MMKQIQQNNKETELATKKVGSLLFQLAIPAITAQMINLLYNLVDRMYIGHMRENGALALTGMGVVLPVIMLVSAFAALAGFGGAPRASIFLGGGEKEKAEETLGNCVTAILCLSLLLTVVCLAFSRQLLGIFGASTETLPFALAYMRVYLFGTVFVQISLGLNMFISSQGFTTVSMRTVLIGAALNIILDPIFIYAFDMGVRGAALATILSQAVSALWVLRFLTGNRTILRIRKKYLRLRRDVILPVLALGISPFIMQSTEGVLGVCFNTSLLKYGGNIAVGSMTILTSMMQFSMLPLQGLTQGMQPIVSFNYGAKNPERVKRAIGLTLTAAVIYSTLLWAVCMAAPRLPAMLFTDNRDLILYSSWALRIYMAAACLMGAQLACQQAFLALGNAKVSLFLAVLRKIILLIPLIYILPVFFEDKVFAVFLAEPVVDTLAVTTTVCMFAFTFKRTLREMKNGHK